MDESLEAFNQFLQERSEKLQTIANFTRGEYEKLDITNQSWVFARQMVPFGVLTAFRDPNFQELLLQQLRKHFAGSSANLRHRHTIRLDVNEHDDHSAPHPLMRMLVSDAPEPLTELIDREDEKETDEEEPTEVEMESPYSLAGAYGKLLLYFDKNIQKLAEHLRISKALVRRKCDYVRSLALHQLPLPCPMPDGFMPGPWHARKTRRNGVQLRLEFSYQLEFKYENPRVVPQFEFVRQTNLTPGTRNCV